VPTATTIRDLREQKNLSQDKVAEAAGLTYSKFVRIEEGSGKTTPEEVKHVMTVLKGMEPGTRKLAGRPFKDPAKQAAVKAARESGGSVAEAIGITAPAPAKKATAKKAAAPAKKASGLSKALGKKKAAAPAA
jgi:transcriptional regulator with XRE-family HTH domain